MTQVITQYHTRTKKNTETVKTIRYKSQSVINSFKQDPWNQDWNNVDVEDGDVAYDTFLSIITTPYEKTRESAY